MGMTWFGWFLVFELGTSSAIMFYRAGKGPSIRTPGQALFSGIEMLVMVLLVLTVGTGMGL
jgi:hypothetical protein